VLHAAMDADNPLQIHRATSLIPLGRQTGIQPHLRVRKSLEVDLTADPVIPLVEYRHQVKGAREAVLAAQLRVFVNALVYGNFCRFDPLRRKVDGIWVNGERPGPWNCMPIAATVTAGSRLLLGILDHLVRARGKEVLYRDTDSSLGCLTLEEVDEITGAFESLRPSPNWPVWKLKTGEDQ